GGLRQARTSVLPDPDALTRPAVLRTIGLEPITSAAAMRFLARVCAVVLLIAGTGVPVLCAQSLADVARPEEERRQPVAEGGKVYTNKDLKPVAAPAEPATDGDQRPATPAVEKDAAGAKDKAKASEKDKEKDKEKGNEKDAEPVKDQKYWAERMR